MMRIAGMMTGAALAVAVLIVTFGVPEFVTDHSGTVAEPIILPLNRDSVARPADDSAPDQAQPAEAQAEPEPPVAEAETPLSRVAEATGTPGQESNVTNDAGDLDEAEQVLTVSGEDLRRWYAFWSPFRSQLAADGFVTQLQRVTGLDYRVVKVKNGVYEVAFAYADDDEVQANLSQISAATGLELPGG